MDEDYARKLRAWLRAEPGAIPRRADEEREWLREVPEPGPVAHEGWQTETADSGGRWSVRGQLPAEPPEGDDWVCPVIALPVPRASDENGCRMSEAEARSRWNHPANWHRRRQAEDRRRRDEGR